jgi:hypothetical protein
MTLKAPKCARCHHPRESHFLEAGACHHVDPGNRVCSCQRYRAELAKDPYLRMAQHVWDEKTAQPDPPIVGSKEQLERLAELYGYEVDKLQG